MSKYSIPVWKMIVESIKKEGLHEKSLTFKEIISLVQNNYSNEHVNTNTIRLQTISHTVNHHGRIHFSGSWKTNPLFITDQSEKSFRLLTDEERVHYTKQPITETSIEKLSEEEEEEDTLQFAQESMLEEYIFTNWNSINFGEPLELYDGDNGRQYHTDVGIIDFLCKNKEDDNFVVIELKKGRKSDDVVGQILRYIGWVKKNLANDKDVRGIIITGDEDKKLDFAISTCSFLVGKKYEVKFELV